MLTLFLYLMRYHPGIGLRLQAMPGIAIGCPCQQAHAVCFSGTDIDISDNHILTGWQDSLQQMCSDKKRMDIESKVLTA